MRTNIDINDDLMRSAMKAGQLKTKRETVEEALRLFIRIRRQTGIRALVGKVAFDPSFDHKALRRRDSQRISKS